MLNVISVQFSSSWNEGDIDTAAKLDLHTGEVFDIEKSEEGAEYQGPISEFIAVAEGRMRVPVEIGSDNTYRIATGDDLAAIRNQYVYVG